MNQKKKFILFVILQFAGFSSLMGQQQYAIPGTNTGTIIRAVTWYGSWSKYVRIKDSSGFSPQSAASVDATSITASGSPPTGSITYSMRWTQTSGWGFIRNSPFLLEFGMVINYMGTEYRQPFRWIAAVPYSQNATPPNNAPQGGFDPVTGGPVNANGQAVDNTGAAVQTPSNHSASAQVHNSTPYPATPVITVTKPDGTTETTRGPTLQPGQGYPLNLQSDQPFQYSIAYDVGDGQIMQGGNGSSSPIVGSTPGGGTTLTPGSPPTTTPTTIPPAGADQLAATNRISEVLKLYGDDAKRADNIANNSLDAIKKLAENIKDKLGLSNTAEAQALDVLGDIADNTAQGHTSPQLGTITPPTETPQTEMQNLGNDNKLSDVNAIRSDMALIGSSLSNLVGSLGLSASQGQQAWNFSFSTRWGTQSFNVEGWAGWFLDLIRAVFLAVISLHFVWRLINTVRGALVA